MCERPENTWKQDHRRLVQLAAKDEPTKQDIDEAKQIIFRTQIEVSVKTNQLEDDYDAMYGRYDWTMDEPGTRIEDWQGQANDFNWAVLHTLQKVQTVARDCQELAKRAENLAKKAEDRAAKVKARNTSAKYGSAQAKAGEEPKDNDSGAGGVDKICPIKE